MAKKDGCKPWQIKRNGKCVTMTPADIKDEIKWILSSNEFEPIDGKVVPFIMSPVSDVPNKYPKKWDKETEGMRKAFQAMWDEFKDFPDS